MEEKLDQRVRLTRNLLKNALAGLMQEQHISKISVRALCEAAGINRSTFYMHYSSPQSLLQQVEAEVMANLRQYLRAEDYTDRLPVSVQVLTHVLEYAKENSALFQALLSENCDYAFQKDIVELAQVISFQMNNGHTDTRKRAYIETYGISGCISVFQKWLQDGTVEPPAQIAGFVLELIYHGVLSLESQG